MTTQLEIPPKVGLILSLLEPLLSVPRDRPLFVALSGIQGSGKSTLVTELCSALQSLNHRPVSLSIDDFYLPAFRLTATAEAHPGNKLLSQRGQPGTHDVELANDVLGRLRRRQPTKLPMYDKGAKGGKGDRMSKDKWKMVEDVVDVVVLEGWCVGFQPLSGKALKEVYEKAKGGHEYNRGSEPETVDLARRKSTGVEVLLEHKLEDLLYVNDRLREYCGGLMDMEIFDAIVHLDAEDLEFVYEWRIEQEHKLRSTTGQGMSDEEVEIFGM